MTPSLHTIKLFDYTRGTPMARAAFLHTLASALNTRGAVIVDAHVVRDDSVRAVFREARRLFAAAALGQAPPVTVSGALSCVDTRDDGQDLVLRVPPKQLQVAGRSDANDLPPFHERSLLVLEDLEHCSMMLLFALAEAMSLERDAFASAHPVPSESTLRLSLDLATAEGDVRVEGGWLAALTCETASLVEVDGRDRTAAAELMPSQLLVVAGEKLARATGQFAYAPGYRFINGGLETEPRVTMTVALAGRADEALPERRAPASVLATTPSMLGTG